MIDSAQKDSMRNAGESFLTQHPSFFMVFDGAGRPKTCEGLRLVETMAKAAGVTYVNASTHNNVPFADDITEAIAEIVRELAGKRQNAEVTPLAVIIPPELHS